MKISIIGTAGRREDGPKLTPRLYQVAYQHVFELISEVPKAERDLVSGGAAWMDHLAVMFFNAGLCNSLSLYLPCAWDRERVRYEDTGIFNASSNPGGTSNHYHRKFSRVMGGNSLQSLQQAMDRGAQVEVVFGFKNRNRPVGKVDWVIAGTFGPGDVPKDGGTLDTWANSTAPRKIHIPLGSLIPSSSRGS